MNRKIKQLNAFSGHSPLLYGDGGHSPLLSGDEGVAKGYSCVETKGHKVHHASKNMSFHIIKKGFTLAEVLITLGVIGVVAAVTMPTLVTNIQERVRKEQVRTVKYKFTKATEKMNSLGKIGRYNTTMDFVNELKNHLSIAKICDKNHLGECWGGTSFSNLNGSKTYTVADLTTGKSLEALQFNSGDTDTVGIVTGDGVPIILTYGKECQALDETKQYQWSVVDGKPETNATAGCVSMVFDINGKKGPNKLGTDVRTMNSILGKIGLGNTYKALTANECNRFKSKLDIKYCGGVEQDYWAGAVKTCYDMGLHLPSMATLAKIASVRYGITVDTFDDIVFLDDCHNYNNPYSICKTLPTSEEYKIPITEFYTDLWSSEEFSAWESYGRRFRVDFTNTFSWTRSDPGLPICVAD